MEAEETTLERKYSDMFKYIKENLDEVKVELMKSIAEVAIL
jgi:hypothetical protein